MVQIFDDDFVSARPRFDEKTTTCFCLTTCTGRLLTASKCLECDSGLLVRYALFTKPVHLVQFAQVQEQMP